MKLKKTFLCPIMVISFVIGSLFTQISAYDSSGFDFSELLDEREADEGVSSQPETVPEQRKTQISDFEDVKENDWFYPYLEYLVENEMIKGKTETSFEPYSTFSYAECSTVIVRYLGLEKEASRRFSEITARQPEMKNQWYVGYFEVLANLGLFADYGLFETDDGSVVWVDKNLANSPIQRYRFAESISQSFEMNSELKAKNVFYEMGGSGREFIAGGAYKEDVLSQYKELINDFNDIPEESAENVLKAYYNGIFNGDISGNFYPHNNLTRGEMAKVLATVSDYSLRTRLITDEYARKVTDDMLHTDAFGVRTMKFDEWTEILTNEMSGVSVENGRINYTPSGDAPMGYAIDVYLYEKNGTRYTLEEECTLRDYDCGGFTYLADDARVLLVLRNVSEASRVEGVVNAVITDGEIEEISPMIREM